MNPNNPTAYNSKYSYSAPPGGGGDIKGNNPNFSDVFGSQNTNAQNFNQSQQNQVGAFTGAYNAAARALPTYQTLLNNANKQYNVQPLAQNAANLQNTLLEVPKNYSDLTKGSDTNSAQLQNLIGQRQWELAPVAEAAQNSANVAQGLANTSVGYGVQNEAQQLSPYTNTVPLLTSTLAGASSNFGAQQQAELQALTDKLNQGVILTNAEQQRLNDLKIAEEGYNNALAVANTTGNYALNQQRLANLFQNVGAGNTLINTSNGSIFRAS